MILKSELIEAVMANPAGNGTALILTPVSMPLRQQVVRHFMGMEARADDRMDFKPDFKIEQLGFVDTAQSPWHLEMMGGEFCGNAARSFGYFIAREQGLRGKTSVCISISGITETLQVDVDTEAGSAWVEIPKPHEATAFLKWGGEDLPVFHFDGISHIIAPGIAPAKETFYAIKEASQTMGIKPDALGVMFWDAAAAKLYPAVYVYKTDTLVFESSCGSGTAAMAVFLSRDRWGTVQGHIDQPGGCISFSIVKQSGRVLSVAIGGAVSLGPVFQEKVAW
ncbi:diaminopimelate epimerase [Breznakiellaceae bacterium SP9]